VNGSEESAVPFALTLKAEEREVTFLKKVNSRSFREKGLLEAYSFG
jgi:hypothetical protein